MPCRAVICRMHDGLSAASPDGLILVLPWPDTLLSSICAGVCLATHGNTAVLAQYLGGSTAGERGEKLFQELCSLWPPGSVLPDTLRKVPPYSSAVLWLQAL